MDAFVMVLSSVISLSKLLILRYNWKHTYSLVKSIAEDWSTVKDSRHRRVMMEYSRKGSLVATMMLYLGFASGLSFVVKALPLSLLLPSQQFSRVDYFLATYCVFGPLPWMRQICVLAMQAAQIFVNVVAHCGNDGFFFYLTMHLCGQFEVLKMNFAEIETDKSGHRERIGLLVKRHCRLLVLADDLEQSFNMVMLIQLLMSTMLLCVEGFTMLVCLNANDNIGALKCIVIIVTLLMQLYIYTYAGDSLESQTEEIAFAAYDLPWYRSPGRVARDLVLIIDRGNSPYSITAGKFVSMNLYTFKEILKASTSYLSVLKAMMDKFAGRAKEKGHASRTLGNSFLRSLRDVPKKMNASSSKDFAYAMIPLKILAWPVGTWPLEKFNVSSILRFSVAISLLVLMMAIVQTEIYLDHSDPEKNLDTLVLTTCAILAISKVALFRLRATGLMSIFTAAVKDYDELSGVEKRAIVRQHAFMGRVACASVICFSYLGSTLFLTLPMLAEDEDVPIKHTNDTQDEPLDYPIPSEYTMLSLNVSENLYPVIYLLEYAMMLITSTGNLGSDGLIFGITFHLCGQAEVLKLDFGRFASESEAAKNRFDALTSRHCHILNLIEQLNHTLSSILVIQLFTSCVLICTSGVQFILSLSTHNVVMVIKTFIVVTTLLTQLFAYSYVGEYLKNQMEDIGYSIYCSCWYDIPPSLSKDIVFVLLRTQVPVHLKAGKFFVVNMETYMSIVKTSMSYLSVLRVMITS
ncbi:odorant receptor 24a-like [Colletes gigas]|uniref:odorant receptor 24a-like n=1 Tax=Colletes gigas TaxID=935657 RepID=UPI001C9B9035|nr:odorant receptor 24a-like [Colletes gigas]